MIQCTQMNVANNMPLIYTVLIDPDVLKEQKVICQGCNTQKYSIISNLIEQKANIFKFHHHHGKMYKVHRP